MVTTIKVEPRVIAGQCGVYEIGHQDSSLRVFITDRGRLIAINHRVITADDLIEAYSWGRAEQKEDDADFIKSKVAPFVEAEIVSQDAAPAYVCKDATLITDEDLPF